MKFFKNKKKINIQLIIVLCLSAILFYYSFKTIYHLLMKINKKTKFTKKFIEKKHQTEHFNQDIWGRFIFYTSKNCNKCKKIKELWNQILSNQEIKESTQTINGCRFNNKIVEFVTIDCDDDENSCFNVKSYPSFTLELINSNKKINYNNSFTINNIKQWLQDQTK